MLTVVLHSGEEIIYPDANWVQIDPRKEVFFGVVCYRDPGDGTGAGELARFQIKEVKRYTLNGATFDVNPEE